MKVYVFESYNNLILILLTRNKCVTCIYNDNNDRFCTTSYSTWELCLNKAIGGAIERDDTGRC